MAAIEGLRERKKRETREAIRAIALRLFADRGFDDVTVAEIAEEAGVSEKTVFNHFAAKEDLVFSGPAHNEALVAAVRGRAAGESIVDVFRGLTDEFLDRLEKGEAEGVLAVPRLVMTSRALRDRLFLGWESEAAVLGPVIAEEAPTLPGGLAPAVVARTLAWTHRLVFRAALPRLLAGEDPAVLARELRPEAATAYDLLERGLAGLGA